MAQRGLIGLIRVLLAVAALATVTRGAEGESIDLSTDADKALFFTSQVEPILTKRCLKCHGGGDKIRGELRVDDREALFKGGELGPAVDLDDPSESLLLQAIHFDGLEMPPSGKIPDAEIRILERWVKAGAPWSGKTLAPPPMVKPARVEEPAAPVWPYKEVVRPAVPVVKGADWTRNPIDAFILARLEAAGLSPAVAADRIALIRRATYDLTGLPPSPEEVSAFVGDPSPTAYERLIDRLLASPQYGEAWGRHWLDLVRYAETNGYERDSLKPLAWKYRDYVIDAFNQDKPYDRFLHEQLAGDEIDPDSEEARIATGFYRLGLFDDEPADRLLARYDMLDGLVSTAGQVFLGMTVNCARCHDHKKDPIPQTDYYRMMAIFVDVTDSNGRDVRKIGGREGVEVMCVTEQGQAEAHVLLRGNPNLVGPRVEPGVPGAVDDGETTFTRGPGKRRAFAEWLTDRRNPMTARVLSNRLWQYHFGRGIVPSTNDFGQLGEPSTHPELLDWLAAELMDGGWKIKRMHRLIMLSSAYRTSSNGSPEALARDPANQLFWRFPMRRLTAEEVRDSILTASGDLNPKAGGVSVRPPISDEVLAGQSVPGQGWKVSPPAEAARRSVYVHVKRSLLLPILATHDAADTDSSCPVRYTTTVSTQALGFLNGAFTNEQAARLAARLEAGSPGDLTGQIREAIVLTTCRAPEADEVARDSAFIGSLKTESGMSDHAALVQYCLLTLNANAFLYLD